MLPVSQVYGYLVDVGFDFSKVIAGDDSEMSLNTKVQKREQAITCC